MQHEAIDKLIERKQIAHEPLTFHESIQFLTTGLPSSEKELFKHGEGIERSRAFFLKLDNPQDSFRALHVAGTSGKGTVSYMIESLLRSAGKTTGLHTSPHVYDIRERSMISGQMITESEFAQVTTSLIPAIFDMQDSPHGRPTYFEATNAIAFSLFRDAVVDYAVIETGLGGLYDSTNTVTRNDKLAIITKLGLDHVEVLGDTIDKIAHQKAGIMPYGGYAVAWRPAESIAEEELRRTAAERDTDLHFVDASFYTIKNYSVQGIEMDYHDSMRTVRSIVLPPGAEYQAENAALAIRSLLFIADRDGIEITDESIQSAFSVMSIPGRGERTELFERQIILDGAHNPQKISAFMQTLETNGASKPVAVIALKKTKEANEIFRLIEPHVSAIFVTEFFTQQDGPTAHFAYRANELVEIAKNYVTVPLVSHEDNVRALQAACSMAQQDQTVLVMGSFYLLGELRDRLYAVGIL